MEWHFIIRFDQKDLHLKAERIYLSEQVERIKVMGRNRSIVLQSNRPMLRLKGLKNKRLDWKLIEGQMNNSHVLQAIILKLERLLKTATDLDV
ncbi:MAG: hypothetical protein B7Y15_14145 [Bacteroidetes bacterium 24-39-8]|jgi:hypothetical protein|nr:MAG: hypothetical protein B7Y76_08585 [Sphingobacteriia bacterium 35-40-5]OYZ47495.1 MAG: hypothetical protein B7Y15_14145 [Bacteroidetes bacterium 24-39-8]OZA62313.1 MAG: hypothetical protein B7X72_12375 [Sphingobacteriia bacterium 39-39-8]HQR94060.1 hypothetical protein [Sediminibacterium sp.]HQS56441.1 hypothetical protein [Sediminibacterium sp.]